MIPIAVALLFTLSGTAHAADASWHTYTDAARGFSISYPDGWKVNPNFADQGYGYAQGESDDVRSGVAFSPTVEIAPGTNLDSRALTLAVEAARPGDTCRASAFLEDPPPDYFTQVTDDKPDMTRTFAEPGDMYDVEHIVLIVSHAPCLAVQYYLTYSQDRPHDEHPEPHFDRAAVLGLLNRIAATMRPAK